MSIGVCACAYSTVPAVLFIAYAPRRRRTPDVVGWWRPAGGGVTGAGAAVGGGSFGVRLNVTL